VTRQRHLGAWRTTGLGLGLLLCASIARADSDNPYSRSTDAELTSIAADWESLTEDQRRALLTEMRARMEAKKDGGGPVIEIRAQRRYGRLVRQPDGSVVRVETTEQIVGYGVPESSGAADRAFGVGFEHRAEGAAGDNAPPTTTASTTTTVAGPAQQRPAAASPKPVLVDQPSP